MSTLSELRLFHEPTAATFKLTGRGTMQQAPTFRRLAEQYLSTDPGHVRIDLRDCTYMDSTFLGTLLSLARLAASRTPASFALVSPSERARELLTQMGLAPLIPVIDAPPPQGEGELLADETSARSDAFQEAVVTAHQELATVPSPGCAPFKAIAAKLSESWAAEKQRRGNK